MIRLDDMLEEITYIRPGDDLLSRGLYVDLPPYGRHLFRLSRESIPQRRRSRARADQTDDDQTDDDQTD